MVMSIMVIPRIRGSYRVLRGRGAVPDWLQRIHAVLRKVDVIVVQIHKDSHVGSGGWGLGKTPAARRGRIRTRKGEKDLQNKSTRKRVKYCRDKYPKNAEKGGEV